MPRNEKPEWAAFEAAVAAFLAALDPSATVQWNVRLPDRHTGRLRQRDVWIETRVLGHIPVSILVSCKHYRRKLHQGDIDAFEGERQSSSAQIGVLYSHSGFTQAALEKARALGLSCCRLFRNEPPDIPLKLAVPCYSFRSQIRLAVLRVVGGWESLKTYDDLFNLKPASGADTVLEQIAAAFGELDEIGVAELSAMTAVTEERSNDFDLEIVNAAVTSVRVRVVHRWKAFKGRRDAYLVNGSYSETDKSFRGQVAFPILDTRGTEPGPDWEQLREFAEIQARSHIRMVLHQPEVKNTIRDALGTNALPLSPSSLIV